MGACSISVLTGTFQIPYSYTPSEFYMNKEENEKEEKEDEEEITQLTPEEESQVQELERKFKEMEDKYLRACADFENYRKRAVKEKEELARLTTEKLLRELLEVKDHLEMALDHAKDATEVKGLREGVTLTLKQLNKFLEKFGVKEIEALGENFDPAFHEAIQQTESSEYKPGAVVQVFQKGYLYHGRLLRAARVTVAAEKRKPEGGEKA